MEFSSPDDSDRGLTSSWTKDVIPEIPEIGLGEFRPGWRVEPHIHRHWEFWFQSAGRTEWRAIGGRRFRLGQASFYSIGPNINHWLVRCAGPGRYMSIGIDLDALWKRQHDKNDYELLREIVCLHDVPNLELAFLSVLRQVTQVETPREANLRRAVDELVAAVIRL